MAPSQKQKQRMQAITPNVEGALRKGIGKEERDEGKKTEKGKATGVERGERVPYDDWTIESRKEKRV